MKKFYFILVVALSLLTFTGCVHEHTFSNANCTTPKTCTSCGKTEGTTIDHDTTKGKCSMCGLDYYDALKDLIKKEGEKGDDSAYSNAYTYHVEEGDYIFNLALQKGGSLYFNVVTSDSTTSYSSFSVKFDKAHVKNQKYDWKYSWNHMYIFDMQDISGQLYAPDFSHSTSALSYSNSSASSSSKADQYAKDASKMLKFALEQIKILMEKSDQNISPANFGFEHFE